jgi:hypothetical protein
MPIPYLIMFEGRNGSSQLVSLLNAHAHSLCYPELMPGLEMEAQSRAITAVACGTDLREINGYAADDNYYPQGFERKWADGPFTSVGFKSKISDFKNMITAIDELEGADYRLIHLRRQNPLKAVLSWINGQRLAAKTQHWNARHPGEIQGPISVDMGDFKEGLRRRQMVESLHRWFFDNYRRNKIAVYYEDMLSSQYAFLSKILSFLGSPSVQSAFVGCFLKNTPDSLRAAVLNYDDLVREFGKTEFARYLD